MANVWALLSKEFVLLIVISCAIATPISYYILAEGLKSYEDRTEISWLIFIAAGSGALIITLATVSFQSVNAAIVNPVKSLRSE